MLLVTGNLANNSLQFLPRKWRQSVLGFLRETLDTPTRAAVKKSDGPSCVISLSPAELWKIESELNVFGSGESTWVVFE